MPEGCRPLGSSVNSRVWKFSAGGENYIFKEFLPRGPLEYFKAVLRGTRSEKAVKAGRILTEKGFLTPSTLAFGVKYAGIIPVRNFLVTRFVSEAYGLDAFLKERMKAYAPKEWFMVKCRIMRRLGETIGRLHAEGVVHGDLRPGNVLVKGWEGAEPEFYFIDNERNSLAPSVPHALLLKNLVQLNMVESSLLSRADRARFFKAYISSFPRLSASRRSLAKEVWAATKDRMEKLGVPLA